MTPLDKSGSRRTGGEVRRRTRDKGVQGEWRVSRLVPAHPRSSRNLGISPGSTGYALSVLAIIAFHSGLSWIPGGYYGVDAFFVLSGFLITALLLAEWGATGRIGLRHFWGRRARRLLPALFLLVAVTGVVMATLPGVFSTPDAFENAFWTVFYGSNWYLVHAGVPYFSLSSQPSPWTHTWSLAIEEQFYLLWPIMLLVVLGLGTRRSHARSSRKLNPVRYFLRRPASIDRGRAKRRRLHLLFLLACAGVLASAALMAHLAPHGYDARAYYGTDTRAQALLVGAAIAIGITLWDRAVWRPRSMRLASGLTIAGVAGTAALWATTAETSNFAFRGGFLAASLAAGAVVLGCVVAPRSLVARLLELPPLPYLGRLSYGMYLWYWPTLLVTSGRRLDWGPYELFVLRVVLTVAIAALSYGGETAAGVPGAGAWPRWLPSVLLPPLLLFSSARWYRSGRRRCKGSNYMHQWPAGRPPRQSNRVSTICWAWTLPPRKPPRVERRREPRRPPALPRPRTLQRTNPSRCSWWAIPSRAHSVWD